jgi:uncharacterized integral membrane protein
MGNIWLKIKVWTKLLLFAVVAVYILVFVAKNSETKVDIWVFPNRRPTQSVLVLVLVVFLCGVLVTLLVRTTLTTMRQIRDLRERGRAQRLEKQVSDMQTKAAKLQIKPVDEGNKA